MQTTNSLTDGDVVNNRMIPNEISESSPEKEKPIDSEYISIESEGKNNMLSSNNVVRKEDDTGSDIMVAEEIDGDSDYD